jgi:hypothetical protein
MPKVAVVKLGCKDPRLEREATKGLPSRIQCRGLPSPQRQDLSLFQGGER